MSTLVGQRSSGQFPSNVGADIARLNNQMLDQKSGERGPNTFAYNADCGVFGDETAIRTPCFSQIS